MGVWRCFSRKICLVFGGDSREMALYYISDGVVSGKSGMFCCEAQSSIFFSVKFLEFVGGG